MQPAISSFLGIAPGEIVSLKGSGLGSRAILVPARAGSDGLYLTQLSGVHRRSSGFNGVSAPLLYTSATSSVAAVAPYGVNGPTVQVIVTYCQGQTLLFRATVQVFAAAPGLFTADRTGAGQAAADQPGRHRQWRFQPGPAPGSVISLYATGGGQTSPVGVDGQLSTIAACQPVTAGPGIRRTRNGSLHGAIAIRAGPAPGEIAGLMQINVLLPLGLKTGSAVPVAILVGTCGVEQPVQRHYRRAVMTSWASGRRRAVLFQLPTFTSGCGLRHPWAARIHQIEQRYAAAAWNSGVPAPGPAPHNPAARPGVLHQVGIVSEWLLPPQLSALSGDALLPCKPSHRRSRSVGVNQGFCQVQPSRRIPAQAWV